MKINRDEVLSVLQRHQETIRALGVERMGLFGSCARGDAAAPNDLDFVVAFKTKSFDAYMDLKFLLEDLFHCPIDLVLESAIKPRLRPRIMKERIDVPGL